MRSSATLGTGQLRLNVFMDLASAIVVIGCTCALGRNHWSAERVFRRALHRKRRSLVRRFTRKGEAPVGIILLEAPAQLEAAGRDLAEPAPLTIRYLEHFGNAFLRGAVPFAASGANVLVLDLVAAFFQLAHGQENALQNIERLEAGDHDGDPVTLRDRKIFFIAHDGANVARGQESLDDAVLR